MVQTGPAWRGIAAAGSLVTAATSAGDARGSFLLTSLSAFTSAALRVHRAKLEDLDQVVVEAIALLLEQDRPAAIDLDGSATSAMTGSAAISNRLPTILSNSHFITTSQSAIGRSATSITGTLPIYEYERGRNCSLLACAARRMSTGSTQSFFSMARMRASALIGSEKITRSTRVRRPNSTRSSTLPSLGWPAHSLPERLSARSSNKPMISRPRFFCRVSASITAGASLTTTDDDGAQREIACLGPAPHQHEHDAAECEQREEPDDVEAAEPNPRELFAGFEKERSAYDGEEHERPRRGEPHVLLLVTAKRLDLINVGGLEGDDREHRDRAGRPPRNSNRSCSATKTYFA